MGFKVYFLNDYMTSILFFVNKDSDKCYIVYQYDKGMHGKFTFDIFSILVNKDDARLLYKSYVEDGYRIGLPNNNTYDIEKTLEEYSNSNMYRYIKHYHAISNYPKLRKKLNFNIENLKNGKGLLEISSI